MMTEQHMKRIYITLALVSGLTAALLSGCGGGGSSSNSLPPGNMTYRNVALASDKTYADSLVSKDDVKYINDGINNQNNNRWQGFKKDDYIRLVFNDYKKVDKLVLYTNDIKIDENLPTKIISIAQAVKSNGDIDWIDVYFNQPETPPTVTTTNASGQVTTTTPAYLVCSSYKAENNAITCNFSEARYILFARVRLTDNQPASQYLYEFEVWGNDAPR